MPTTDHGAPYPAPLNARDVPADIKKLADWADDHGVHYAIDAADRNDRYADLPVGALVSSGGTGEIWQKAAAGNKWNTVFADTGWVETGFQYNTGVFGKGSYMKVCRLNSWVELRGEVEYVADEPLEAKAPGDNTPGNMADTNMITVPPAFYPGGGAGYITVPWRSLYTGGMATMYTTGKLTIVDGHTSSYISAGHFVRFSVVYRQG